MGSFEIRPLVYLYGMRKTRRLCNCEHPEYSHYSDINTGYRPMRCMRRGCACQQFKRRPHKKYTPKKK